VISPTGDDALRIQMNKPGIYPNQTYTDMYYSRDAKEIRCSQLNMGIFKLSFCITGTDRVAVIDLQGDSGAMDAEVAAQYVMERMIKYIEAQ